MSEDNEMETVEPQIVQVPYSTSENQMNKQ